MARLVLLAGFFLSLVCFTEAYNFYVGVRNGWVLKPAEKYNSWAERMRFQVKDKLIFDYKKGEDSVLVVKKEDYESCNTKNPIKKFEDGKSVFIFDRSGPFFFISGADGHCAQGQKLIVVVMAVRNKPIHPPSSPAIPPSTSSPSPSISPSPAPAVKAPTSSPSPAPAIKPPSSSSPSPAPVSKTPSFSPTPAPIAISPSSSPTPSSSSSPTISPASSQAKSPSPASELSTPPSSSTPGSGGSGGGGGVPATPTSSSNSTSTPTSASAQTQSISRLSYAIFTLFLGAVVVLF